MNPIWLVYGTIVLMAGILGGRLPAPLRRRLVLVAAAAGILQLVSTHYALNPLVDRRFFEDPIPAMRHVRSSSGPARIYAEPPLAPLVRGPTPILVDLGQVDFLPPVAQVSYTYRLSAQWSAGVLGLENSFTADPEHILLEHQATVNKMVHDMIMMGEPLERLLRLGSVDYAFFKEQPPPAGLEPVGAGNNATTRPVGVYRVPNALPRAYLVSAREAVVLPAGQTTMHRLLSTEFDPARQVVLEKAPLSAPTPEPANSNNGFSGEARLLRRDALNVEVEAAPSAPAYLVLTDSYNPDWRVTVNGKPALLLRANQMFRAVALPAGRHRVAFRYRPMSLAWGAAVTLATALLTLVFAARQKP